VVALPWKYFRAESWATQVDESHFPVRQTDFIRKAGLTGNLFNFYDNGGYLIYRLYPQAKVFIDSRCSPYAPSIFQAHDTILAGGPEARQLLDRFDVDILLIRSSYFPDPEHDPVWHRAFTDGHYDVYTRKNRR
jgi:hypothetical protein